MHLLSTAFKFINWTLKGATASGQIIPCSSWDDSIIAPAANLGGTKIIETDAIEGYDQALRHVHKLVEKDPDKYFFCGFLPEKKSERKIFFLYPYIYYTFYTVLF